MKPHTTTHSLFARIASTSIASIILGTFVRAHAALAVEFDPDGKLKASGLPQSETTTISTYIFQIIQVFLQTVGVIALVLIIYGGFTILISNGDPGKIKKGKDVIFWSIIGTLIILSSLGIINFLEDAL